MHSVETVDFRKNKLLETDPRLKRLALQLVVQLPEDVEEALITLRLAETVVRSFVAAPRPSSVE